MWRGVPSWRAVVVGAGATAGMLRQYGGEFFPRSFTFYFFLLSSILLSLRLFWTVYIWPRYISSLRYLPQPAENASFWASVAFITEEEVGRRHRVWINSEPNDGLLRYHVLGGAERIFLTSPKAISEAFVQRPYDYHRPAIAHEILSRVLGVGLLLAEGDEHRVQRKNLTPAFSVRHVKALVPTFYAISARMVQALTAEVRRQSAAAAAAATNDANKKSSSTATTAVEAGTVVFDTWASRATLDIIGAAGMGVDFGAVADPDNELSRAYRKVFNLSTQEQALQLSSLLVSFRWLKYLPLRRNRELREGITMIRATARGLIERKQAELSEKGASEHKDILSIALESGHFTVDHLVDQVMTFLAAGHETTSTATQWAMLVLAMHPEMQVRLRSEVRAALPSLEDEESQSISAEALDQMPFLRAFCHEMLRFWPPVTFTQRTAVVDTQIIGHFIPKGTNIVVVAAAMNFSKELWGEDADQFDPERWLRPGMQNTGGADTPYANMTFTTGPRGCIGAAFAKHEFMCLVAAIIGRFEVALDPPDHIVELETSVVTRPKGGLPLRMTVIGGW